MSRVGSQSSLCCWALSKAVQGELHWGKAGIVPSGTCGSFSDSLVISSPSQYWYNSVMFHTCWREKQATLLELMLFSQQSSHWTFMVQKIGVGPYSAGSTSALKIIGFSCCLGHEGSGLIHQLKHLASTSQQLSAHPPVPRPEGCSERKRYSLPFVLLSMTQGWSRQPPYISSWSYGVFSMTGTVLRASIFCWHLYSVDIYILLISLCPPALAVTQ